MSAVETHAAFAMRLVSLRFALPAAHQYERI